MEFSNQSDDIAFAKAQEHYTIEVAQKDKLITLQHAIPVTIEKIIPWVKTVWMPAHPDMKFVTVSECLGLPSDAVYKSKPGKVEMVKPDPKAQTGGAASNKATMTVVFTTLLTIFYFLF